MVNRLAALSVVLAVFLTGMTIVSTTRTSADSPREKSSVTVTFAKHIAPILYENCASCHRPGEVAPFSLLSYEDAKKRAKQLAIVTHSRHMPPWKAQAGYGQFLDERRLSAEQIAAIRDWADSGAPLGNAAELPKPPRFPAGWTLGEPDAVIQPSQSFSLAAEGKDVYQCFVVPTNYAEDHYLSAIEVRPENRAIVHHVIAFLDSSGKARELDSKTPEPGYASFGGTGFLPSGSLGGWAPGNLPRHLPDGVGIRLPKGADIVLQVHYHKSGKVETDRTRLGLYFSKRPVEKQLRIVPVLGLWLNIPPADPNYAVKASLPMMVDATILQVMPHMHLLGKDMTVKAVLPDGTEKPMVKVPDWDFNWQTTYTFREPLKLPRGSRVELLAHYDNSSKNPRNPSNPPRRVGWGEETTDEMCIAFLFGTVDAENLTQGKESGGFRGLGSRRREGAGPGK